MSNNKDMLEKELFEKQCNEEELNEVSGGRCINIGSYGSGNCEASYYLQACTATVEVYSRCKTNDWCFSSESHYDEVPREKGW